MELDELKTVWDQHEKTLIQQTAFNKELLKKLLMAHTEKRIDWLKIRSLVSLIIPLFLIIFVVIPQLQFTPDPAFIIGIVLSGSLTILTYFWAIRLYLHIERLSTYGPVTTVKKQLKLVEKYKLKISRYGLLLAPLMIIGIFLAARIRFLSPRMIPFYALMVIVYLFSQYVRSKHGLVAQIRKIDMEIEEISRLEMDQEVSL